MDNYLYNNLLKISKKFVLDHKLNCDFEEFLNDCYIAVIEENQTVNEGTFREHASKVLSKYKNEQNLELPKDNFKFCKKCKEDKPIGSFGITSRNEGKKNVFQFYCTSCQSEIVKQSLSKPENIIKHKARVREWQVKNHEKILARKRTDEYRQKNAAYMREYYKKKKGLIAA